MKLLLLAVVIAIALWVLSTKRRKPRPPKQRGTPGAPATMLACAHCGVHLPQPEAMFDAAGRAYCTEAHRLAGPQ